MGRSIEEETGMSESVFKESVYKIVRAIPKGKVITYGHIAVLLGIPRASQQVGWALHWVNDNGQTPCQRVVNRFGGLADGYGWGGQLAHKADLDGDGVEVREDFTVDLNIYQWWPNPEEITALDLPLEALDQLNSKLEFSREQLSRPKKKK